MRKVLAKISDDEKFSIDETHKIINSLALQLKLLESGKKNLWRALAEKYQLPQDFEYDIATGEIFETVIK